MKLLFGPGGASDRAAMVDPLFIGLCILSAVIVVLVVTLIVVFGVRYRAGSKVRRGPLPSLVARELELGWTVATLFVALFIFWWAANLGQASLWPPQDALEIHVEAKQWMWKTRHPEGAREINALHLPVDRPVKLYMTSEDVIHSFFVPAFRVKRDVVPGRTNLLWFTPTETGRFKLLCAEFCGTDHSAMVGTVTVMSQGDYADWLASQPVAPSLVADGEAVFVSAGCAGCHAASSGIHAPALEGIFGRQVPLSDGRTAVVDEAYVRNSILKPKVDVAAGYDPIMPSFDGLLGEGDLQALVAYIASLGAGEAAPPRSNTVSPSMRDQLRGERP